MTKSVDKASENAIALLAGFSGMTLQEFVTHPKIVEVLQNSDVKKVFEVLKWGERKDENGEVLGVYPLIFKFHVTEVSDETRENSNFKKGFALIEKCLREVLNHDPKKFTMTSIDFFVASACGLNRKRFSWAAVNRNGNKVSMRPEANKVCAFDINESTVVVHTTKQNQYISLPFTDEKSNEGYLVDVNGEPIEDGEEATS